MSPQVDRQPGITCDLQELILDQFAGGQVPCGKNGRPEVAQSIANGNGSIQVWSQVDGCMGEEVDSWVGMARSCSIFRGSAGTFSQPLTGKVARSDEETIKT